jgi:hypothetical protein
MPSSALDFGRAARTDSPLLPATSLSQAVDPDAEAARASSNSASATCSSAIANARCRRAVSRFARVTAVRRLLSADEVTVRPSELVELRIAVGASCSATMLMADGLAAAARTGALRWYLNGDSTRFLGEDELVSIEDADPGAENPVGAKLCIM